MRLKLKPLKFCWKNLITALSNFNSRFFLPGLYACLKDNNLLIIEKIVEHLKENNFDVVYSDHRTIIFKISKGEFTGQVKEKMLEISKAIDEKLLPTIILPRNFAKVNQREFFKNIFIPSVRGKKGSSLEFSPRLKVTRRLISFIAKTICPSLTK